MSRYRARPDRVKTLPSRSARTSALWAYLSGLCFFWAFVSSSADESLFATFWAYAPRWVWALPIVAVGVTLRRPTLAERLPLMAGVAVVLGPVMGFTLPNWSPFTAQAAGTSRGGVVASGVPFRVVTANMGSRMADPEALAALIRRLEPDVVLLQECSERADRAFEGPWHYRDDDALCVASRYPIMGADHLYRTRYPQNDAFITRYAVDVSGQPIDIVQVHLDTPRDVFLSGLEHRSVERARDVLARRAVQARIARSWMEARVNGRRTIVAGDFNLTEDSSVYRESWRGFENAFSVAGFGWGFTKRAGWLGARIDHILVGDDWRVDGSWVESSFGSDHRPLVADLTLSLKR